MSNAFKPGPIEGLLQYVNRDVKPYHTKVIEVLVEYLTKDDVRATMNEAMELQIQLGQGNLTSSFRFNMHSIGTTNVDNDTIVLASNTTNPMDYLDVAGNFSIGMAIDIGGSYHGFEPEPHSFIISGSNGGPNYFTVVGDQTFYFPPGKQIVTSGMVNNKGAWTVDHSSVNGGNTRIYVDRELSGSFIAAGIPTVTIQTGNNGRYIIKTIAFDHTNKRVNLVMETPIPYATMQPQVDGSVFIRSGRLGYVCLDIIRYQYPLAAGSRLPRRVYGCEGAFGSIYDSTVPEVGTGSGFDEEALDGLDGFDSGTFTTDVSEDPGAPYLITGIDPITNSFTLPGDVREFFPYSRQFRVIGSAQNDRQYNVLIAVLNMTGDTVVHVIEDVLYPYNSMTGNDGIITTPGYANGQYLYGFGFDQPKLCSAVPEMHAAVAFAEQLVIQITDSAEETQPLGWDDFGFDQVLWDTNIPGNADDIDGTVGWDPLSGYDSGYDP